MSKKNAHETGAPQAQNSSAEPDERMLQFQKGLEASCQESLLHSLKDTSGIRRFFDPENIMGTVLFFFVWLLGGFYRFLLLPEGSVLQRLTDRNFLLFPIVLALFLIFFIFSLNVPTKRSRAVPKLQKFLLTFFVLVFELSGVYAIGCWSHIPTDFPWQVIVFVPLTILPALLINLLDEKTAICTATLEAILLPLQFPNSFHAEHYKLFCFALIIAVSSVPCFRNVYIRIQYLSRGLLLGFIIVLCGFLFFYTTAPEDAIIPSWVLFKQIFFGGIFQTSTAEATQLRIFFLQILFGGIFQGLLTGSVCILLLPILERLFKISTPMTLMELTDVNAPLLQRLRKEAPGTYQHSLDVAEMATNAASQIGADAKLIHVMSLYHDVGKLFAPQYFAENMNGEQNPLENSLRPQESALLIFEHTTHGADLARKYLKTHLAELLIPAIHQHHGNTLLAHFYQKACAEAAQAGQPMPSEKDFRYPQVPATSREVAILSLADSCEAAVRALLSAQPDMNALAAKIVESTRNAGEEAQAQCAQLLNDAVTQKASATIVNAIDQRIASVIQSRLQDHQLDHVDLTTRNLAVMARSFRDTILSHFHTRPEYRFKR